MENITPSPHTLRRAEILRSVIAANEIGAELGVHKGGFSQAILQVVKPKQLHLIDPWYLYGKEWYWAKGNRSTMDALVNILRSFEDELVERTVTIHIGYDFQVLETFPDAYFDWVYLDTSHTHENTLKELALLMQKVKKQGVIAGDDWYHEETHRHHGVYAAVHEFIAQEPYELVYADNETRQWAIKRRRK